MKKKNEIFEAIEGNNENCGIQNELDCAVHIRLKTAGYSNFSISFSIFKEKALNKWTFFSISYRFHLSSNSDK